jgi:hypothetical protein
MPKNRRKSSIVRKQPRKTLAELNAWLEQRHGALLKTAHENCLRLTGKPTFGGAKRRKSA